MAKTLDAPRNHSPRLNSTIRLQLPPGWKKAIENIAGDGGVNEWIREHAIRPALGASGLDLPHARGRGEKGD